MTYPEPFDLTGRVAVVTGAGGGLGRAFAGVLAEAGATVACAERDLAAATATAAPLGAVAVELDVTDEDQVAEVVPRLAAELGGLDVLVNNAGIGDLRSVPLHRVRTEHWRRVLAVDLDGVFLCSRAALAVMVEQGSGKIVNVASMFGLSGARISPIPAYSAAKGAVVNLTRELGLQYAAAGIQVNALCPGFVRTGLSGGVYENPEFLARLQAQVPMGRIAEPAELRGALLLLSSAASDYMTGQTLVVDGGCTAG
ncbi:SDR family NAD(P)-dependent oxidoreductase [Pseudonocardia pini]|uniref:SDR family NAD(P)-dependent oxidoreductase n=1 Tax=Pseudonocardia pini TaxID=2758030 RepID=UPI0015F09D68|nr:SDR family oxidoreductase [Pseudonocardia pini]